MRINVIQLTTVLVCSLVVAITMPTHTTATIAPVSVASVGPHGCPRPGQDCTKVYLPLVSRPLERQVGPFEYVGSYIQPDTSGVEIDGSTAYVTGGDITFMTRASLLAIDISDPTIPMRLSVPNDIRLATKAHLVEPYLYGIHTYHDRTGLQITDFRIVDVSDPISPTVRATLGYAALYGIDVVDGRAYGVGDAMTSYGSLDILDITNPDAPDKLATYAFSQDVLGRSVHVREGHAFIGGINREELHGVLIILDVSNPAQVTKRSELDFQVPAFVRSLELGSSVAYLATGSEGVQVVDLSNLDAPQLIGSYDTPSSATELFLSGTLLYVADGNGGLQILDVSNPGAPQLVAAYNANGIGEVRDVEVVDDLIYLATSTGLHILRYRPD